MQGPLRKVVHATLFELIAIVVVTLGLHHLLGEGAAEAGGMAVSTSVVALMWNMVFNTLFEAWERRQADRRRTVSRRLVHAVFFEAGLVVMTVPLIAWWLRTDWWSALVMDVGLVLFFVVYGFLYNWLFDHVFGLPASARMPP